MSDPRDALEAIGSLPDAEIDIGDAALQLARVDAPDADWQAARAHLSELVRGVIEHGASVGPDADLEDRVQILAEVLGGQGYAGDTEQYEDMVNANLIRVIERRRGLPVSLGILWLHCAQAAGWGAHGVDFPGHFLIALEGHGRQMMVDVFTGGDPLDAPAMRALIKRVEGEKAELRPGLMTPMSTRAVLLRLQNNIKLRRLRSGDLAGALSCTQDMLRFAPEAAALWREAAAMHEHLDEVSAALKCFERFLALQPDGEAAEKARAAVNGLRSRLN